MQTRSARVYQAASWSSTGAGSSTDAPHPRRRLPAAQSPPPPAPLAATTAPLPASVRRSHTAPQESSPASQDSCGPDAGLSRFAQTRTFFTAGEGRVRAQGTMDAVGPVHRSAAAMLKLVLVLLACTVLPVPLVTRQTVRQPFWLVRARGATGALSLSVALLRGVGGERVRPRERKRSSTIDGEDWADESRLGLRQEGRTEEDIDSGRWKVRVNDAIAQIPFSPCLAAVIRPVQWVLWCHLREGSRGTRLV